MSETCNHEGEHSITIFGVRLTAGTNNNTTTNNNNQLSEYQQPPPQVSTFVDASYVSNNVIHAPDRSRKCKRGVPWTEEEQKLFLLGLQKLGKGDWKGISRKFVKTRTPIQVASHAQKHFLHRPNQNRRREKPSVFDLTIETVLESSTIMKDEQIQQETVMRPVPVPLPPPTPTAYPSTHNGCIPDSRLPTSLGPVALLVLPISCWIDLNDNGCSSFTNTFPLSLKLQSLSPSDYHSPESSGHSSPSPSSLAFNSMSTRKPSGGSGDNITNVHVAR